MSLSIAGRRAFGCVNWGLRSVFPSSASRLHLFEGNVFRRAFASGRHDLKAIIASADKIKQNIINRMKPEDKEEDNNSLKALAQIKNLYEEFCSIETKLNNARKQKNANADTFKKIASQKPKDENAIQKLIEEGKQLKTEIEQLESQLDNVEKTLDEECNSIPNDTHPEVPIGEEPKLVYTHISELFNKDTQSADHMEIAKKFDLLDFESGASVTGSRFVYMKNEAALLELALANWAMTKLVSRGFTPMLTPDLAHKNVVEGCGFQPRSVSSQIYSVSAGGIGHSYSTDMCLIGTSEITLAGIHANKILMECELPIKYVGFSHCFRAETGQGSYSRGLYRLHQFSKVEMFAVSTPEQSNDIHLEMLEIEQEIMKELGLTFRVLDMPTSELGMPAYRKFDVEAWMPSRQDWGEVTSTSNCTDYQARRLNIRYRPGSTTQNKPKFAHTINGTAVAMPRILLSLMECFYDPTTNSVAIPPVLVPFLGGRSHITVKQK